MQHYSSQAPRQQRFLTAAALASVVFLLGVAGTHHYLLLVSGSLHKCAAVSAILTKRFHAFDRSSGVSVLRDGAVAISTGAPPAVVRRLAAPGTLTIKAFPSGALYRPPGERVVAEAWTGADVLGNPAVFFKMSDGQSFHTFTERHVNETIVFYIDGHVLQEARIIAPLSGEGQIVGSHMTAADAETIAALLSTKTLPCSSVLETPRP